LSVKKGGQEQIKDHHEYGLCERGQINPGAGTGKKKKKKQPTGRSNTSTIPFVTANIPGLKKTRSLNSRGENKGA